MLLSNILTFSKITKCPIGGMFTTFLYKDCIALLPFQLLLNYCHNSWQPCDTDHVTNVASTKTSRKCFFITSQSYIYFNKSLP